MLILMRKAGPEGMLGTTVFVGENLSVRVMAMGHDGADLVIKDGSSIRLSHVPYGRTTKVGDTIVIGVTRASETLVRLGIDAPKEIAIERDNMKERRAAA